MKDMLGTVQENLDEQACFPYFRLLFQRQISHQGQFSKNLLNIHLN